MGFYHFKEESSSVNVDMQLRWEELVYLDTTFTDLEPMEGSISLNKEDRY